MASVRVTKSVFQRSGPVIVGSVTFVTSFSDAEVKNNIGFIPALFVMASRASTTNIVVTTEHLIGAQTTLYVYRKEVAVPLKAGIVRPSASPAVETTVDMAVAIVDLFTAHSEHFFDKASAALDVRVTLSPEISASKDTVMNQRIGS